MWSKQFFDNVHAYARASEWKDRLLIINCKIYRASRLNINADKRNNEFSSLLIYDARIVNRDCLETKGNLCECGYSTMRAQNNASIGGWKGGKRTSHISAVTYTKRRTPSYTWRLAWLNHNECWITDLWQKLGQTRPRVLRLLLSYILDTPPPVV